MSGGGRSKRRSRSSHSSSKSQGDRGRESPIGAEREREFPTTKIGSGVIAQADTGMGGGNDGHDRSGYGQYGGGGGGQHGHGRCSGGHGSSSSVQPRSIIQGDLVQSRDFHYTVEQPQQPPVYRRPREVVAYPGSGQGSRSSRVESRADYAYVEHKSSPYHTGTLRTSVRGLPDDSIARVRGGGEEGLRAGRLDQNYMMVRAQSRLQDAGYDRLSHRSDSRGDLLDSDHNSIYDHGLYYQPGQYSGFVRTCDGKFIRTNIPQHDFETLDTNFYRNSSAMHTMRRTSKNRHQSHGNAADYCCPSRDDGGAGAMRASDQLQQSYATLRGRKYTDKQCRGGVGDNYGRNTLTPNFLDDARSVHSLADDFFLPTGARAGAGQSQGHAMANHSKTISRSTDKSLDSLGLEEDHDLPPGFAGLGGLANLANLRTDDILATMLKREPPDGKEKPEPPAKHQKLENNSRKNSKCDLLETDTNPSGNGGHAPVSKTDSSGSKRDSNMMKENTPAPPPTYLDTLDNLNDEDLVSERLKDWSVSENIHIAQLFSFFYNTFSLYVVY